MTLSAFILTPSPCSTFRADSTFITGSPLHRHAASCASLFSSPSSTIRKPRSASILAQDLRPNRNTPGPAGRDAPLFGGSRYGGGSTSGTSAPVLERVVVKKKIDPGKKFKVIIFNDETHTKTEVINILRRCVPELTKEQAESVMEMAHKTGKGIVGVWIFEMAEAYCDLIRNNGLGCDIEEE